MDLCSGSYLPSLCGDCTRVGWRDVFLSIAYPNEEVGVDIMFPENFIIVVFDIVFDNYISRNST